MFLNQKFILSNATRGQREIKDFLAPARRYTPRGDAGVAKRDRLKAFEC